MLYSYKECMDIYGNDYQIDQAVKEKRLFKIEPGIYSTKSMVSDVEVIQKKYPDVVFAGEYAFYELGMTDVIPDKYCIATRSKSAPLKDPRIVQIYIRDDLLNEGVTLMEINGSTIRMYDRERMLIELIRNRNTMPYDLYKEIIKNYRATIKELEIWRIQEYTDMFPKSKMIRRALSLEVF